MSKYTNSYGVTVNLEPWFDKGFGFTKLHLYEELGGKIPCGEIDMDCDGTEEALSLITSEYTGRLVIEKEGGNIYDIDIFITDRRYFKNTLTISFVCIKDKKFFTDLVSTEWTDITDALQSLYPGKLDIRCESDINNGVKIFQTKETNYSLCTKLAYSYRHNTVFGYSWSGMIIKEIIGKSDSSGHIEPYWSISGNVDLHQIDSYCLTYNKLLYNKPYNPWTETESQDLSEKQAINNRSIKYYNSYLLAGTDYYQLLDNYFFNKRFMETDMYVSFRAVDLDIPIYKLGDVLKYSREEQEDVDLPFKLFLVRSNELFFAIEGSDAVDQNGLNFSWTTKFIGLEENGSILPDIDPVNNNKK